MSSGGSFPSSSRGRFHGALSFDWHILHFKVAILNYVNWLCVIVSKIKQSLSLSSLCNIMLLLSSFLPLACTIFPSNVGFECLVLIVHSGETLFQVLLGNHHQLSGQQGFQTSHPRFIFDFVSLPLYLFPATSCIYLLVRLF